MTEPDNTSPDVTGPDDPTPARRPRRGSVAAVVAVQVAVAGVTLWGGVSIAVAQPPPARVPADAPPLVGDVVRSLHLYALSARVTPAHTRDDRASAVELIGPVRVDIDGLRRPGEEADAGAVVRATLRPLGDGRTVVELRRGVPDEAEASDERTERFLVTGPVRLTVARTFAGTVPKTVPETVPASDAPAAGTVTAASPSVATPADRPDVGRVSFRAENLRTAPAADGRVSAVLTGGVLILQRRPDGGTLELLAERAVVYTTLQRLGDLAADGDAGEAGNGQGGLNSIERAVTGVYLEGDVRVLLTPPPTPRGRTTLAEQRLEADRAFYDLTTDRATLVNAILRTTEPRRNVPITLRARTLRQTSIGRYEAENAEISTSRFALPEYSLRAARVRVERRDDASDVPPGAAEGDAGAVAGGRASTTFRADDVTLRTFGLPIFYLPRVGADVGEGAFPLRNVELENSRRFGTGVRTRWGVFETLGVEPSGDVDASYRVDYFSDRGPGFGLDATYRGEVEGLDGSPGGFVGDFTSYGVYDTGVDRLGRRRFNVDQDGFRGRALWQHQQFLSDDLTLQWRAGYVSDETFLEQWFEREFNDGLPHELSAYVKRIDGQGVLTIFGNYPPNDFVTTSNQMQELTAIQRLPEVGYHRLGDGFGGAFGDRLTFYSDNTVGLLRFSPNRAPLGVDGYGLRGFRAGSDEGFLGIPSYGYTSPFVLDTAGDAFRQRAYDDTSTFRLDSRQQIDVPLDAGPVRIVPYAVGRYTLYSDSVDGGGENRLLGGGGVRASTTFWRVDDTARSRLFDIDRVRHVIEPQVHLFTAWQTTDRADLLVYDEEIDGIEDVRAARVAVRQTWQTKRGGPGRQRSVDFLTLNVGTTVFDGSRDEPTAVRLASDGSLVEENADAARGLYFDGVPEASVARDTVDAQLVWRPSDSTFVISEAEYNLEKTSLATVAVGFAAERGERVTYFVGGRYLGEIHTAIGNVAMSYELTDKYTLTLDQSFDFSENTTRSTQATVFRRFDRMIGTLTVYFDRITEEGGVRIGLFPIGLGPGVDNLNLAGFLAR